MILVLFLGILIILFMYIFGIPCFFYKVTSFYSPGCGFTRAVFALLHFDIYQVLRYNLLIVIYIPLILYCLFFKFILKKEYHIPNFILYAILILACLFGVLRNIPCFDYLAPTVITTI